MHNEQMYDIIVIGGGHAGIEAALAASRMNNKTLMVVGSINRIGNMPCNPSIGGPAKGIIVREIDALGGEMGINIDKVIDIEVPDEKITKRMSGRRVCSKCANSYHMEYKKPKVEGICDACGGELVQRKDDAPETVQARLVEYHEMTEPLKGFYENLGKLRIVEGQEEVADTTKLVFAALED